MAYVIQLFLSISQKWPLKGILRYLKCGVCTSQVAGFWHKMGHLF